MNLILIKRGDQSFIKLNRFVCRSIYSVFLFLLFLGCAATHQVLLHLLELLDDMSSCTVPAPSICHIAPPTSSKPTPLCDKRK